MSTPTLPNPQEWFQEALSGAFRALQEQHYELRVLGAALDLILKDHVDMSAAGDLTVASGSTEGLAYDFPAGTPLACQCEAAQFHPLQPCKHHVAALLYSQATQATKKRLAAWEAAQLHPQAPQGDTMPTDAPFDAAVAAGVPYTPPAFPAPPGALETVVTQWQHDPHSITIKGISRKGYEILLCVRGLDLDASLKDTEKAIAWMQRHDVQGFHPPPPAPAPLTGDLLAAAAQAVPAGPLEGQTPISAPVWDRQDPPAVDAPSVRCPVHPTALMTAREKRNKKGDFYYAHQLGPKKLCFGRE